jgi:hypothetical protein
MVLRDIINKCKGNADITICIKQYGLTFMCNTTAEIIGLYADYRILEKEIDEIYTINSAIRILLKD